MKKSFLGVVLSLGLLSAAHADVYKFDNTHTNAVFNIDHFQTSTNHGGFYAISGELKYQPEKQDAEMRVTIPVSALNTGVDAFDNHIRSSDIFIADATINTPNGHLVASAKHEDMYTAINELINKLERQLNKVQHKGEARRATASVKDASFVEAEEE